jgi:hypothetical protein
VKDLDGFIGDFWTDTVPGKYAHSLLGHCS